LEESLEKIIDILQSDLVKIKELNLVRFTEANAKITEVDALIDEYESYLDEDDPKPYKKFVKEKVRVEAEVKSIED